jgi:hypothetical protein
MRLDPASGAWVQAMLVGTPSDVRLEATLAWLGPSDVLVSAPSEADVAGRNVVLRWTPRGVERETLPLRGEDFPRVLRSIDGIGTLAGSDQGVIVVRKDGQWAILLDSRFPGEGVRAFAPAPGGLLFSTGNQLGQAFLTASGTITCPLESYSSSPILRIVPLSTGYVLVPKSSTVSAASAVHLTPRDPLRSCSL